MKYQERFRIITRYFPNSWKYTSQKILGNISEKSSIIRIRDQEGISRKKNTLNRLNRIRWIRILIDTKNLLDVYARDFSSYFYLIFQFYLISFIIFKLVFSQTFLTLAEICT